MKIKLLGVILRNTAPYLLVAAVFGYGYYYINTLESDLAQTGQELQVVSRQYNELAGQYNALEQEFNDFTLQVSRDLEKQQQARERVNTVEQQRVTERSNMRHWFEVTPSGETRNFNDIIDRRPAQLQLIINRATMELRDELKNNTQ